MQNSHIEHRTLPRGVSLSFDLAQHIFIRGVNESVVVTDRPHDVASAAKKQWYALIRLVQRERASTLKAVRIAELSNQMAWMQQLIFTSKAQEYLPTKNYVLFATYNDAHRSLRYSTLYITIPLSSKQLYSLISLLQKDSAVIIYKSSSK